jgi:hypothetical protein
VNVADTIMMLEAAINEIKRLQLDPATIVSSFQMVPNTGLRIDDVPVKVVAIHQQNGAVILGVRY